MFILLDKLTCFCFKFRLVQKKDVTFCDMPNIIHTSYLGLFALHVGLDLTVSIFSCPLSSDF